jgi:hypothetical protein
MVNGGGAIVILRACVSVAFELSFTCTVKFPVPAAVGVPVMVPPWVSDRPAGSEPVVVDHVLPPVPPPAASVRLYAVPTVPGGSDVVLILSVAALKLAVMNPATIRQNRDGNIMAAPPLRRTGAAGAQLRT